MTENARRHSPGRCSTGRVDDESTAEDALESLITGLVLSNALAMSNAERDALFERILGGEGVTVERDGDWVEIHLVGKAIAALDLHWLVRKQAPPDTP